MNLAKQQILQIQNKWKNRGSEKKKNLLELQILHFRGETFCLNSLHSHYNVLTKLHWNVQIAK